MVQRSYVIIVERLDIIPPTVGRNVVDIVVVFVVLLVVLSVVHQVVNM
jgi:hypothetical protein